MLLDAILLIAGLTVLYFGAEAMVKGASQLALSFGISPLVVGLTVVAFGTSAPEFLVSFLAVVGGSEGISVGNVIGSNICNIALILGIAAVISPLPIAPSSLRFEYPFMFLATLALAAVAFDGRIGHIDGGILTVGIVVFIAWQLRGALRHHHAHRDSGNARPRGAAVGKNILFLVGGLVGLTIGAHLMVTSASSIARSYGVSDFIIGTTIVAFGTSLPELATSVIAAVRRQADISVGNILGSNIFNSFFVMGLIPLIFGLDVEPRAVQIDLPAMILITVIAFPLMRTRYRLGRGEGGVLLGLYGLYMATMFLWPKGLG
jgi:cation:H+ antiporter